MDLEVQSATLAAFVAGETALDEGLAVTAAAKSETAGETTFDEGLAVTVAAKSEMLEERQAGKETPHATIG